MMKKVLLMALCSTLLFAKSNTEKIGDFLAFAIPAVAYGDTFYFDDAQGRTEFYKSYGTTMLSVVALKHTVKEKRPDNNDRDSFPSGHTASTVSAAAFVHKRYGLMCALPLYAGAIYTGYSRIHVNRHHPRDVAAGAFIGALSAWYFTTTFHGVQLSTQIDDRYQGARATYRF